MFRRSHPASPNFGKHWTAEQVHDMFAPSEETVQAVRDWLVASGIEESAIVHSENKGWLALDIPTWQAEDLFNTEYHEHVHSNSGQVRVGCDEYVRPRRQCSVYAYHFLDTIYPLTFEAISTMSPLVSNYQQL
jgi:subtilase family serine protease